MAGFVVAYVPTVEVVDEVTKVKVVDNVTSVNQVNTVSEVINVSNVDELGQVDNVSEVNNVTSVDTVDLVRNVDNVDSVDLVDEVSNVVNVETVQDVRKLPHPYFPLKKYNYQYGGSIQVTSTHNMYQAVYVPHVDSEFKGVHLCCAAYNLEDTYDVMIGSRFIIQGSHVKEMAEYRMFEVYEIVEAGTPIVIQYHNNSGLEKVVMFEVVTLIDSSVLNTSNVLEWNFDWRNESIVLDSGDTCSLVITQPSYVNMNSTVDSFDLVITNSDTNSYISNITYSDVDNLYTNYIDSEYPSEGYYARSNVIAIINVIKYSKSIEVVFKNISTALAHPIEIGIQGTVINEMIGGY